MSIVRVHKHAHNFVIIDKTGLADTRLSYRARGILAYLLTKPDDWEVQYEDLVHGSPAEGRIAVAGAIQELERYGYAKRHRLRAENGRMSGWHTEIHECPTELTKPDVGTELTKPDVGKKSTKSKKIAMPTDIRFRDVGAPPKSPKPKIGKGDFNTKELEEPRIEKKRPPKSPSGGLTQTAKDILAHLNATARRRYEDTSFIVARLKTGASQADCLLVIDWYAAVRLYEWDQAHLHFNNDTLFRLKKFSEYLGRARVWEEQGRPKAGTNGKTPLPAGPCLHQAVVRDPDGRKRCLQCGAQSPVPEGVTP